MKQTIIKILVCIVAIIWITLVIFGGWSVVRSDGTDVKIWEIANELNLEKDAKQRCLDNLTYYESIQSALWFDKPCVMHDERIMELQAEVDAILFKDYQKAGGLVQSRQAQ